MYLSNQIIEIIEYLCAKFGIAIDWTSENILPYIETLCNKYIRWEIATSSAWIILSFILILIGIIIIKKHWQEFSIDTQYIISIVGLFVLPLLILSISIQIFDIIKCCTFPEMQIYEYLSSLMK